ncbi:GNAT family N-acetyltransferase [Thalassomonas sp. RHCl1]|uniref:GNAT family N-acetyltransferase n=1 Tax=Thalassomonas sp. RHCl1 TaxID=2995320 RepID=UPI00248BCDF4|nr:GNAT family N-acetyltransferase [Thalassomonas sp. RHCl1]
MITSGFATPEFLQFCGPVMPAFVEQGLAAAGGQEGLFPYFITKRGNDLLPQNSRFVVSPICFSGCSRFDFRQELAAGALAKMDISGGFLQSRDLTEQSPGLYTSGDFIYYLDSRGNYRLDSGLDEQALLKNMKRDSRARVRKIFSAAQQFELVKAEAELDSAIEVFARLYSDTAQRANFGGQYLFTREQWQVLFSSPLWQLFLLKYRGEVVAGAAVSQVEGGYDYTFMGYKACDLDVSRALIVFIYQYLQNSGAGFLDLGGGISEADSLARFKSGLGARLVAFSRARFARRSALDSKLAGQSIKQALTTRWP